jgi:uncharacterized protein involved in exopolysaccharide biosynthesis
METKPSMRPISGQDLIDIWKRRRWLFLGITAFVAAATCVVVGFLPSSYRSDALILIEQPAVSEDYVKPLVGADDERQISRLVQQVLSHTLLQRLPMFRKQEDISQEEFDDILKDVSIDVLRENSDPRRPAGKPYGLKVSFRSSSPKSAQEGGNELAALVVQEADQMTLDQARETGNVLRSQLQLAVAKVQQTNQALADFRKQFAGRLPIEEQLTIETLARLQEQLDVNGQAIARARQTIADLNAPAPAPNSSQDDKDATLAVDPNLAHLETDLQGLKVKLADLESRYKPNHPDVLKARDEIQRLEAQVQDQAAKNAAPKTSKSAKTSTGVPAATISKIHDNEAELAARLKEQAQIQQDIARYQSNLSEMPSHAQQFSDLQREYDAAKKDYETARDSAAAADQTTDVYQQHKGVHFRIQDYASLPDSPDLPVRWKINLGGLGGGLFLGLLVAAILELRDTSFKSAQDVEYYTGVRNLALLPDIPSQAELQRARRAKLIWITGTAAMALVLAGLNAYIYLVRLKIL